MATPFTYRGAGDRLVIFASEYNAFIDAAVGARGKTSGIVGSGYEYYPESSGVLPATYSTPDAAVPANGIVEISSAVYPLTVDGVGFRNRVILRALKPTGSHVRNIGIAIRGAESRDEVDQDDNVRPVQVSGVGIVRVLVENEAHDFAGTRDGDVDKLGSDWTGAVRILHKQPVGDRQTTGEALCVVELGADYPGRWFTIAAAAESGDPPVRYNYTGRVARKTTAANAGWVDLDTENVTLYHALEYINDGSGVEGHGVDIDGLPGTFGIQPIPVGTPVFAQPVISRDSIDILEWWITAVSPIDGACGSLDAQEQRELAVGRAAAEKSSSSTFVVVDRWSAPFYEDTATFAFNNTNGTIAIGPGTYRFTLDAAVSLDTGTDSVASIRFAAAIDGGSYAAIGATAQADALALATMPVSVRVTAFLTVDAGETAVVQAQLARASGTGTVQIDAAGTIMQAERLA